MSVASIKAGDEEQMQEGEAIKEFEDRVLKIRDGDLNNIRKAKFKENCMFIFSLNLALRMLLRCRACLFNTRSSNSSIVSPSSICSSSAAFILATDIGL